MTARKIPPLPEQGRPAPRFVRPSLQTPVPDFDPVPRQYRHDGWTAERQTGFIHALAETGSVKAACARVGKTTEGAYQLRRQPGAQGFRAAWEAALAHGIQRLTDIAIDRAIDGVAVPIFQGGKQVGEKRWYNDRLLMFLLRHHQPARYGPQAALPLGTRHPDTIAREAAEAHDTEAWLQDRAECLAVLARHHRFKTRCAAEARLIGNAQDAAMLESQARQLERAMEGDAKLWSIWSAILPRLPGEAPTHAEEERAALGLDPTREIGGDDDGPDETDAAEADDEA